MCNDVVVVVAPAGFFLFLISTLFVTVEPHADQQCEDEGCEDDEPAGHGQVEQDVVVIADVEVADDDVVVDQAPNDPCGITVLAPQDRDQSDTEPRNVGDSRVAAEREEVGHD